MNYFSSLTEKLSVYVDVNLESIELFCCRVFLLKGRVINNLRVGPEDRVMGHDTFGINFVGFSLKILHYDWVTTHFFLFFQSVV